MSPLIFHGKLPVGALVRPDQASSLLPAPPPIWFRAKNADSVVLGPEGKLLHWTAGARFACPVKYNNSTSIFDPYKGALRFSSAAHAGLAVDDALPDAGRFSFAVILHATAQDPRTLVTVQMPDSGDYLFLSGDAGSFRLAMKSGDEVAAVTNPGGAILLSVAVAGQSVCLALNDLPPVTGKMGPLSGPARLFLGCRGDSRSLMNKIGCFDLFDVMIWPGMDVLQGAQSAPDTAVQTWQERQDLGL